ncbi:MAG: response regulator [Treponema sp.]|nr:response regulator [Treponema sp.]MCL2237491.1 response regulator [Treponema sp.]
MSRDEEIDDDFTGHRLLLVEDMKINREIVMMLLKSTHLEIECAENGLQAVEMFMQEPNRYEIIFMDIHMPGMNGYETTREIRQYENKLKNASFKFYDPNHKPVPIIAITANTTKEDNEKSENTGMNDHIGKPLDYELVIEKLRQYLC